MGAAELHPRHPERGLANTGAQWRVRRQLKGRGNVLVLIKMAVKDRKYAARMPAERRAPMRDGLPPRAARRVHEGNCVCACASRR